MAVIVLAGPGGSPGVTTTALALALTWPRGVVLAECDYGAPFVAALGRGRMFATQFHPEKSQSKGLQIYRNFAASAAAALIQR